MIKKNLKINGIPRTLIVNEDDRYHPCFGTVFS